MGAHAGSQPCEGLPHAWAACAAATSHTHTLPSPSPPTQQVGFIGLGRMGARMVPRLLDAGYEVVVEDKNQLALERIVEIGRKHPKGT
jgi:D-arabinose 1-dehydrogenase-like Zn-dependent alcohol dehydrogenase